MARLDDLLERTSRTFALSVPLLPEPTRREVTIAYLLFRIADTFEDAAHWSPERRVEALGRFVGLLRSSSRPDAEDAARDWSAQGASPHAGYAELIREAPLVLDEWRSLAPGAVDLLRVHVSRSAEGMARFVARTDAKGELRLSSVEELKEYCYVVAGIVGEMLTELFLLDREPLRPVAPFLRERSAAFGEALQLVNILKDCAGDAHEGRRYLPPAVDVRDVFALARRDLGTAAEYILALQRSGAPTGILGFTALPVRLAWASLDKIEREGPGSKISRLDVAKISASLSLALARNEPAVSVP